MCVFIVSSLFSFLGMRDWNKLLSLTLTELDCFKEIEGERSIKVNIIEAATLAFVQSLMYAKFLAIEELPRINAIKTLQG